MFDTILVAIDGSGHAHRASAVAADLAARYGARLVIAHVATAGPVPAALEHLAEVEHLIDEPSLAPVSGPGPLRAPPTRNPGHLARLHQAIGEHLTSTAALDARQAGVEAIETEVLDGEPVGALLECAKRHGVDAIVLGRRGLSDLKGLLLGSVSHKICQLSACTCVTVK